MQHAFLDLEGAMHTHSCSSLCSCCGLATLLKEMTMCATVPCPPGKTDFIWVVAVETIAKARRCWRAVTGDGQLFTYRYIYLHLFILYLTALPTLQHPLEAVVCMSRA